MTSPTTIREHYTVLIYPFYHSLTGAGRAKRLQSLNDRWKPWWSRFADESDDERLASALDDTYFFLPSLRELLYPETAMLESAGNLDLPAMLHSSSGECDQLKKLAQLPCDALARRISDSAMLRLTLDPAQLAPIEHLLLQPLDRNGQVEADKFPLNVCWADVTLFPQHVGFLAIKVKLGLKSPTDKQLTDFLYCLRGVHPPKHGWYLADWQIKDAEEEWRFKSCDLVDALLEGVTDGTSSPDLPLVDSLRKITQHDTMPSGVKQKTPSRNSKSALSQIYGHSFRPYTYACLNNAADNANTSESMESQLFTSPVERILYELATCTDTSDINYQPHPAGKAKLMEEGHIALWTNWQGMALHDNVIFLGTVANGLTLNALPENVENDYLPLYLLTLYQKIRLSFLSMELTRRDIDLRRNGKEANLLWDEFVLFRNHYWFHEVTPKPQGGELYQKFRQGLGVLPLYESVSEELRDLQEHYERKNERNINSFLFFLTFVGFPISILVDLFSNALILHSSWFFFGKVCAIVLAAYCIVGYLWLRIKAKR